MATLVQPYPPSTARTVTMLQARPASAGGILQPTQSTHHAFAGPNGSHRNSFHGINALQLQNYRGHTSAAPAMPFTFTTGNNFPGNPWTMTPRMPSNQRTSSAPQIPQLDNKAMPQRVSRYPAPPSVSTTSSSTSSDLSSLSHRSGSRDDVSTARNGSRAARPHSTLITSTSSPNLAPPTLATSSKPSPDRYRRPGNRRNDSGHASMAAPQPQTPTVSLPNVVNFYGTAKPAADNADEAEATIVEHTGIATVLDVQARPVSRDQAAKRYRRRSMNPVEAVSTTDGALVTDGLGGGGASAAPVDPLRSSPVVNIRPATAHGRTDSAGSSHSAHSSLHSRPGSARREGPLMNSGSPSSSMSSVATKVSPIETPLKHDGPRLVTIPPRGSSDVAKRNPSPLSRPATMGSEVPTSKNQFASAVSTAVHSPNKPTYAQVANGASPAAQQLANLGAKDGKKSKTSKLRRAFSFGSSAELRRASAENNAANHAAAIKAVGAAPKPEAVIEDEQEAEQARIAERQEAAGFGSGIYSGQGNFFTGSTDNLSISSTASSASVMIRKMGKGMKRSTRSLVGLFRPKSIIGHPTEAAEPNGSQAQVSMVTVEADRDLGHVHARAQDVESDCPKLEIGSFDTGRNTLLPVGDRLGSVSTENSATRQSIVGGEKERAEVLAAVKKGILKRSGTDSSSSSPVIRPLDGTRSPNFNLSHIPHINDSPQSSAPSTPNDDPHGHRRTGSVTLGGEDYFMSALRFRSESKSMPGTPQGGTKRNATFSPRIQFHDTWPSGEYDRRGEIATCNKLTPMLAQQIKEELNTFKMEMEVHENSKIYTHFF